MRKYYICFLLCFILFNTKLFSQFGGGDGTESFPYEIWNREHLYELRDSIIGHYAYNYNWESGKYFHLMADITDTVKYPIGSLIGAHFNGGGKKIVFASPTAVPFSDVDSNGTLDSLIIEGYLTCCMVGRIRNGSVTNCINNAAIISSYYAGGIVYQNLGGTISNCINNGDITGVDMIGGIVGDNRGTVINCISTGKITATNSGRGVLSHSGVGGIVGSITSNSQNISNCINLGTVLAQYYVGGIVGLANTSLLYPTTQIIGCVNDGYISGTNGVGGILGYMYNSLVNISDCVNNGVIEGEEDVGSTVGKK